MRAAGARLPGRKRAARHRGGQRRRVRPGDGARDHRPGRARRAPARRRRHADRAPPARNLDHPDPDADRPRRRGRPRDGPGARCRRLPDQAVQPARAAGAHPRAAAPRARAGHRGRRDRQGARLPLRRLGAQHRAAPPEVGAGPRGRADQRRVQPAGGLRVVAAARADARPAARPLAPAQRRGLRPLDRRADPAPAPQDRGRSRRSRSSSRPSAAWATSSPPASSW